jgi:NAD-dependent dihydropyrimidine dehydrogenase PreA subunit
MIREVVVIDEELCDGCGLCIPSCQEGALQILNGKAKLVADRLCDGLGACLGHCPQGAIRIERREADAFDEEAVAAHLGTSTPAPHQHRRQPAALSPEPHSGGGCPGARFAQFAGGGCPTSSGNGSAKNVADRPSELTHWPVQLHLLSPHAPVLKGARLLVAADCVPIAYAGFHEELLRGRAVVIACPKLDDTTGYVEKLTEMIAHNELQDITVVHMEVPCCTGIVHAVLQARQHANVPVHIEEIVIGIRGDVVGRRSLPADSERSSGGPGLPRGQQEGVRR